jgi:hypothetical protein
VFVRLRAAVAVTVLTAAGVVGIAQPAVAAAVPAQFVSKMYTEALGRLPDPGGWTNYLNHFQINGCSANSLRQVTRAFYLSQEFAGLPYDNPARVLTLYRGALNREPDQGGQDAATSALNSGRPWVQLVDEVLASSEFSNLTQTICGGGTSYYFGTTPAPSLPVSGAGFAGGTASQLQALLNATPAGGTVVLAQKAVIRVDSPLLIPAGVTLTTAGTPGTNVYALQGRLVRTAFFNSALIQLQSGAKLRHVWVDGQRGAYTNYVLNAINVQGLGGNGTEVSNSRLSNSAGWSTLQVFGAFEGLPCAAATVTGNVITAYSSEHRPFQGKPWWTDGLSIACENATVTHNQIVDATDVGIVLFRSSPQNQRSQIRFNTVLSAGNSAYGAMGLDGLYDQSTTHPFNGASMSDNTFWTGPNTHFDIGISVGTRPWFGNRLDPGTGAAVNNNTTAGIRAIVGTGIAVSGMYNATVQGNDLLLNVQAVSNCPHVNFGIDADGYAAGGNFQPGGQSVRFVNASGGGCIGHPQP